MFFGGFGTESFPIVGLPVPIITTPPLYLSASVRVISIGN